jgi:hypothetical protein
MAEREMPANAKKRKFIHENDIWKFIKERGGRATMQEIFEAFGDDEESKNAINEKLTMMARFGIVVIEGNEVRVKRA